MGAGPGDYYYHHYYYQYYYHYYYYDYDDDYYYYYCYYYYCYYYLLKTYSPDNRTGSPVGFSQVQVSHKSKYRYNKHLNNKEHETHTQIQTYFLWYRPCVQQQ